MRYNDKLGTLVMVFSMMVSPAFASSLVNGMAGTKPLPGGLADPAGRTGYLSSVTNGIEAVDLMTGDCLWSCQEAEIPLLIANDRLYAQAGTQRNRLRVLVFDLLHKGHVILESDPVVFPQWVVTSDGPGHAFKAHWRLDREQLILSWQARAWYCGKTKATPAMDAAARKQSEGVARIHLTTGYVDNGPPEPPGVSIEVAAPQKDLEKKSIRWQGVVNGQYKAVVLEDEGQVQRMVLLTWDRSGAKTGEPQQLFSGRRLALVPTLDERIVCIRETAPSPDQHTPEENRLKYAWSMVSLDDAKTVARVIYEASTQAMTVIGPRLFVAQSGPIRGSLQDSSVSARTLKAVDLKTGKFLWQRNIAGKPMHPPER
jgi:hypothetical protein